MARKRRRFTAEFKKRVALEALRERDPVQAIAARYEVHANQVSAWMRQAVEGLDEVFSQPRSERGGEHEATIRDLHAKIGELTPLTTSAPVGKFCSPRVQNQSEYTLGTAQK